MTPAGPHEVMMFENGTELSEAVKHGEINFGDTFMLGNIPWGDIPWVLLGESDGNLIIEFGGKNA